MAMTAREWDYKLKIEDMLQEEGHVSYARLFRNLDLNLTSDPDVIAYLEPERNRIVINEGLIRSQISTIIRHEILHHHLKHMKRMEDYLGKDIWDNRTASMHQASNIAGDYEISNLGYTPNDKKIAKSIMLNGRMLEGLVTEIDHPDWVNLSLEEIYDKVVSEQKDLENKARQELDKKYSKDFIEGWNKAIDDYNAGRLKL